MDCLFPKKELYVIVPYFNFCGFDNRYRLFIEFIQRLKGVHIVIVEATSPKPLPKLGVFKHIRVESPKCLWIKESLINIGIKSLPPKWKYVAWIDADLTFVNKNWHLDTVKALETNDIVQLFDEAIYLGPHGDRTKTERGFGYMHATSGKPLHKTDKYGFWHPGFAWACTESAWMTMGGLLDWAPLGSADRHMALSLVNKVDWSYPGNIHENYKIILSVFQMRCRNLKLSYVPGNILHHWHGSLENRKYRERWDILTKHKFDPMRDVEYRNGVLHLTDEGSRMQKDLDRYFIERREDQL
jgi:hypothetical protein